MTRCLLGRLHSFQLYIMSVIISVCHTVGFTGHMCLFMILLFPSLHPLCNVYISLSRLVSSLSLFLPSSLPPSPMSSSPGCVWWTDVIISTSFIPPSSKEGDDCIYQGLVCLRDASGTVVLHSQSERRSAGKKGGKSCVYFTDKQIDSGNNHIPPFIICVLYT